MEYEQASRCDINLRLDITQWKKYEIYRQNFVPHKRWQCLLLFQKPNFQDGVAMFAVRYFKLQYKYVNVARLIRMRKISALT